MNDQIVTLRELLSNKALLSNLEPYMYPDAEFTASGDMFIKTTKFTTVIVNAFSKEYTRTKFVVFNRNLQPLMGFDEKQINITDRVIIGAFLEYNSRNDDRMITMEDLNRGSTPDFLYIVPANEIMLETTYEYNSTTIERDPYGRDNFKERVSIKTVDGSYWVKSFGKKSDIASENQMWYEANKVRIAQIVSGLTDPDSDIRNILARI